jgi:ABC-type amino acid transport substrate-binding protein
VPEFGFFAYYEPISHGACPDPGTEAFDEHLGYEADLLGALEAMDGTGLSFNRRGVGVWPGIWLLPATPEYDLVGGGITILEERTRDASGMPAVAFTSGHIVFRHSLLVRAAHAAALAEYSDLTSEVRVGVSVDTTSESRLLRIVGLIDETGVLLAGTSVTTPGGTVVADGSDAFRITAGGSTENLAGRRHLEPPSTGFPQVVFYAAESMRSEQLLALVNRKVDALAGDEIGNRTAERILDGLLVVTALDTEVELGGFALDPSEEALLACLDDKLNYLTDERNIGYAEWLANPSVFLERAEVWTP